jgi:radical SAM superfamily enzyme YgiQ (UPF0313 family)
MKIFLINPPHPSIGSRLPKEHLPPLGLLAIGGPLLDHGYTVKLLDADVENLPFETIVQETVTFNPDVVLLGHSGSTSAQPIINELTRLLKARLPEITIIIGGVFPTFHWQEILETQPQIDVVVCGEGEQVIVDVLQALQQNVKGSITHDKEAIQLLRRHHILSMAPYVVGFEEETTKDFYQSVHYLLAYDPDQVQLLYVTPHKWTPYFEEMRDRPLIQLDQTKWDYKHQVFEIAHLRPWQVMLYVKLIELILQTRPKALFRWLFHKEQRLRKAMGWYNTIGKSVWFYEWFQFFFDDHRTHHPIPLHEFWKYSSGLASLTAFRQGLQETPRTPRTLS